VEKKIAERVVPYSDKAFRRAAIEWLVATDQVWASILSGIILLPNLVFSLPAATSPRTSQVHRDDRSCCTCYEWC
jgi:hypothetical protein